MNADRSQEDVVHNFLDEFTSEVSTPTFGCSVLTHDVPDFFYGRQVFSVITKSF